MREISQERMRAVQKYNEYLGFMFLELSAQTNSMKSAFSSTFFYFVTFVKF